MSYLFRCLKELGIVGTVVWLFTWFLKPTRPYKLITKYARHPLLCRPHTSDRLVFNQIFIEREYACLDDVDDVKLVIDCGANVGYSSAYFLSRFSNCYLVAIEPDPENYALMVKNLKPYHDRVRMVNSAVWSHAAPLTFVEEKYRDGKEWSRQMRECRLGEEVLFSAVDIGSLLKESGHERISILKIDVEGAEGVIFSPPNYKNWISKVDVIAIELHDDSLFGKCSEIFSSAVSKEDFDFSRFNELTVCKRRVSSDPTLR